MKHLQTHRHKDHRVCEFQTQFIKSALNINVFYIFDSIKTQTMYNLMAAQIVYGKIRDDYASVHSYSNCIPAFQD